MKMQIDNHTDEVLEALETQLKAGLEAIGITAEGHAKAKCPVDTGRLRNSITHAVGGGGAAITTYRASYGSNTYKNKKGETKRYNATSEKAGSVGFGAYAGTIGNEGDKTVYIGTNVEYAQFVELGTSHQKPQPYLKPAAENHKSEYQRILKSYLTDGE